MKLLAKIVLLAVALTAVSVAVAEARPVRGVWKGGFTAAFNNDTGRYQSFGRGQIRNRLKFRVTRRGKIRNFKARPIDFTCYNRAGEEIASYNVTPGIRKLKTRRRGAFSGSASSFYDGRKFTDTVRGQFTSRRRAKGRYKLKVSGCVGVMAAKFRLKKPRPPRAPSTTPGTPGAPRQPLTCTRGGYDSEGNATLVYYPC